jgi:hypothetical protein
MNIVMELKNRMAMSIIGPVMRVWPGSLKPLSVMSVIPKKIYPWWNMQVNGFIIRVYNGSPSMELPAWPNGTPKNLPDNVNVERVVSRIISRVPFVMDVKPEKSPRTKFYSKKDCLNSLPMGTRPCD